MINSEQLNATFLALADPTRRAILARLMSQPAISKHLKILERAGLISRGIDAQRRPRRLNAQPLAEASAWLEDYRQIWEANFQRLDNLLAEMKAGKKPKRSSRR
jgi:DNA-binding transcriptional ArsR family regulator